MQYIVDVPLLKKTMIDRGIGSFSDLATISGVSSTTICNLKKGIRPSATVMDKIASVLNADCEMAGRLFFANKLTEIEN